MGPVTSILVFIILWWLIFFMMLPIGVRSQHEVEDGVVPGTEPGAPQRPALWKKALWTTLLTALVFGAFYAAVAADFVSFRR